MTECCDDMETALKDGFLERVHGELILPRRNLKEIAPEAKAGNVLTGEVYDPSDFAMAMAIDLCPFCGAPQSEKAKYETMNGSAES